MSDRVAVMETIRRCGNIQRRCDFLAAEHFPSEHPKELAALINRMADLFRRKLKIIAADYSAAAADYRTAMQINSALEGIGIDLSYAEAGTSRRVPWGIVESFEWFTQHALSVPQLSILLCPRWDYNYGVSHPDLAQDYKDLLETAVFSPDERQKVLAGFPSPFHVLSFPQIERTNVFLHPVLGHEVGHLVAKRYFTEPPTEEMDDYVAIVKEIQKLIKKQSQRQDQQQDIVQILENLEMVRPYRESALKEIISDVCAVRLFGPAALLSLYEIARQYELDVSPAEANYYPPWRLRLRYAARALDKFGYFPIPIPEADKLVAITEEIGEIKSKANDSNQDKLWLTEPLICIAYDSLDKAIDRVMTFVDRQVVPRYASAEVLYKHVLRLVERLECRIPPCGDESDPMKPVPATLPAILNAAWFYRILRSRAIVGTGENWQKDYAEDMEVTQRLTLRAIETSHWQRIFQKWLEIVRQRPDPVPQAAGSAMTSL